MKLSVRRGEWLRSCALVALLVTGAVQGANAAEPTYQFNIPAESLSQALTDFSQSSSQQIIYTEDLVRGRKSGGLHGSYTAEQALNALLAGTGLRVQVNAAGVMMVQSKNVQAAVEAADMDKRQVIETVIVTGTHIPGVSQASPLQTLDNKYIERSGVTSTRDLLRTLPQNSGIGASAYNNSGSLNGNVNGNNVGQATGVDLRGLGSDATLVLVNGHRLAPSGLAGAVDISSIPLSAIDHVDVLTDGASAIYGSDAIGGVVNFVLKSNYDGAESKLQYGGSTEGGGADFLAGQSLGRTWGTGDALIAYEYEYQAPILSTDRSYSASISNPPLTLLGSTNKHSVIGTAHQDLAPGIEFAGQAFFASREADVASGNNGGAFFTDTDSRDQQFGGTGSIDFALPGDWSGSVAGTYAQDRVSYQSIETLVGHGAQPPFRAHYANSAYEVEATFDGDLFSLPGGVVKAAFGGGYRSTHPVYTGTATKDQDVEYGYAELNIPIVGDDNASTIVHSLSATLEGRYESYNDFGTAFSPKLGLVYEPTSEIKLRGTWGKAFHAPEPAQLYAPVQSVFFHVPAGLAPGAPFNALYLLGGNPDLRPQRATTTTAGVDYEPDDAPGLRLSTTFFDINYTNQVTPFAGSIFQVYTTPSIVASLTPSPSLAELQAAVASAQINEDFTGGAPLSSAAYLVDARTFNAKATHEQGLDLMGSWSTETDFGDVDLMFNATKLFDYEVQGLPGAPFITHLNRVYYEPSFRGRAGAALTHGGWSSSVFLNYTTSYVDDAVTPNRPVSSWTTVDAQLAYKFVGTSSPLDGFKLAATAQNLFDAHPPYVRYPSFQIGYDTVNANPLGRFLSISIVKDW